MKTKYEMFIVNRWAAWHYMPFAQAAKYVGGELIDAHGDWAKVAGMGKRIRIARGMLNLSQRELAHKLKVTQPAVVHWERGQQYPTAPNIIDLARVLSLSYTLLLEGP